MALTCGDRPVVIPEDSFTKRVAPFGAPLSVLRSIVQRFGTPAFAYDAARIRDQAARLRNSLPSSVEVLYSLKANASLGLCGILAGCGLGADVASAGELLIARQAGFPASRILVSGPDKSPALLEQLRSLPDVLLSADSLDELALLAGLPGRRRVLVRLRPDFCTYASCAAGPDSRFGLRMEDLARCRDLVASGGPQPIGFHVFAGSQVLDEEGLLHHLRSAVDQSRRAADLLEIVPEVIDIGGGFGVPYGPGDEELDLARIGRELEELVRRAAPAALALELGRYLVAQAGWYLVRVLARQSHRDRAAVVVDGGVHQRGDLCGLGLRTRAFAPIVVEGRPGPPVPTDVLGCLSLPSDLLAEACPLPPLMPGDVLAFPNAGAYGLGSSPFSFHGNVAPAEAAFEGEQIELIRSRPALHSLLEGQFLVASGR